jgi:hypothetical protein
MDADFARQGEQLERLFKRDVLGLAALGNRRAARLLALGGLSKLEVWGPKRPTRRVTLLTRLGINAQFHAFGGYRLRTLGRG